MEQVHHSIQPAYVIRTNILSEETDGDVRFLQTIRTQPHSDLVRIPE